MYVLVYIYTTTSIYMYITLLICIKCKLTLYYMCFVQYLYVCSTIHYEYQRGCDQCCYASSNAAGRQRGTQLLFTRGVQYLIHTNSTYMHIIMC